MQIAIIGSGNVGKALAGSFVRAGHQVNLSASDPENARAAAQDTGASAADSNTAAVEGADAVVLAVPYQAVEDVLEELDGSLAGKVLIDTTNRVNPADPGSVLDGTSASEQIQALAPSARVVKAFNTVFASRMTEPSVDDVQLDCYVAGDDEEAKRSVLELAGSIGFQPIDAGPLSMARVLEGMALLNITLQIRNGWPWQSGFKLVGPTG
ncbi:MAG: NADPH-dependent F420 reductase [Actinobacteria bacterium]|nr:NADPH-dependent F420 reductase [Actinomycetota bacterium]